MPLPDANDFEADTGFEIEIEAEDPAPEKALATRPGASFFYVCYPNDPGNWHPVTIETGDAETEPGTYWLPKLQRFPLVPGARGVRTLREGEPPEAAFSDALKRIADEGGIVLPKDLGYVRSAAARDPKTRRPGRIYFDAFEAPIPPRPGARSSRVKFRQDRDARARWVARLIRLGVLPEMPDDLLAANLERLEARVVRHRVKTDLPDNVRESDVARASEDVDRAAAAVVLEPEERVRGIAAAAKATAAPKPARARRAKADA